MLKRKDVGRQAAVPCREPAFAISCLIVRNDQVKVDHLALQLLCP